MVHSVDWRLYDIECLSDIDDEFEVKNNQNVSQIVKSSSCKVSNDLSVRLWQTEMEIIKLNKRCDIMATLNDNLHLAMTALLERMNKLTQNDGHKQSAPTRHFSVAPKKLEYGMFLRNLFLNSSLVLTLYLHESST